MREALIKQAAPADFQKDSLVQKTIVRKHTRISTLLESGDKCISVELCPGRKLDPYALSKLGPKFCSVTWHAAQAARSRSVEEIPAVQLARGLACRGHNVLLHLAGRNLRKEQVLDVLNLVKSIGVRNIFALQGDPSQVIEKDDTKCHFPHAVDLVRFIRLHFGNHFCLGVAGYPDKHPQSRDLEEDVHYLKEKVCSGADFIITQASYDYETFRKFTKLCRGSDIRIPIIPGIFIISSYKTLIGMSKFCAVPISPEVLSIVDENRNNVEAVREFGIYHATELMKNILCDEECIFRGIHIFSLNDLNLVEEVLTRLELLKLRLEYPL